MAAAPPLAPAFAAELQGAAHLALGGFHGEGLAVVAIAGCVGGLALVEGVAGDQLRPSRLRVLCVRCVPGDLLGCDHEHTLETTTSPCTTPSTKSSF